MRLGVFVRFLQPFRSIGLNARLSMTPPKTFIIAEVGVNHNGSLEMARRLVDAAVEAGADAVKFQTFKAERTISRHAAKAEYQMRTTAAAESQLEMVRKLELSDEAHRQILEHCRRKSMRFLSTPFDVVSADFLVNDIGVDTLKIPSGEITNAPFLLHIARFGLPTILSTGMSTLGEVETALGLLAFGYMNVKGRPSESAFRDAFASEEGQTALRPRVSLLHCTTEYPAPFDQVNLRAMDTLAVAFGLPVGLSDHTPGIAVAVAAVARGACIVEKHLTLDRGLPGPDHKASLEPDEFASMVSQIKQVEQALGSAVKRPVSTEMGNRAIARRSLVAGCDVAAGTAWTSANLVCKRPGGGVSPMRYWDLLGTIASRDYSADEMIDTDSQARQS
jgi:N-acetylneuraminate synthase